MRDATIPVRAAQDDGDCRPRNFRRSPTGVGPRQYSDEVEPHSPDRTQFEPWRGS
jgi:hypothetical protein